MSQFHFLFREDKGQIGRGLWWRATLGLSAVWLVIFSAYLFLGQGDITKVGLTAILTIATIMLGVCYYFVSAKRFQDLGQNAGLALILPLAFLFDAAIHWMQPRLGATFPSLLTYAFDAATVLITGWTVWTLGGRKGHLP